MTEPAAIRVPRVDDDLDILPGARLLVDRVWPRGVRRAGLRLDDWNRDVAPSAERRRWFGHDPARWEEFRRRYLAELEDKPAAVARCLGWCRQGPVVLLFAASDREHNQAVVLRDRLAAHLEREART